MNYEGMIFGNRIIIKNQCNDDDWIKLGLRVPKRKDKYKLTTCLNCGRTFPSQLSMLYRQPPKRCMYCSNIGNHFNIETNKNTWMVYDDYAVCNVIYKNEIVSFYIDSSDYNKVKSHVWRISKKRQKYYVVTGSYKKGTMIYLHRFILDCYDKDMEVDHIDGNSLNNMTKNLRVVSRQENIDNQRATRIDNKIGIRGVTYNKKGKCYNVDFHYHGKRYYTKKWNTLEEAVWCRYCLEDHFGLNAIKNNPLAEQYLTLSDDKKEMIQKHIQEQILRNER